MKKQILILTSISLIAITLGVIFKIKTSKKREALIQELTQEHRACGENLVIGHNYYNIWVTENFLEEGDNIKNLEYHIAAFSKKNKTYKEFKPFCPTGAYYTSPEKIIPLTQQAIKCSVESHNVSVKIKE